MILNADNSLDYPAKDPAEREHFEPWAGTKLRDEVILVYRYALVAIIQPDRSYQVSRCD